MPIIGLTSLKLVAPAIGLALLLLAVSSAMVALTTATFNVAMIWPTNAIVVAVLLRWRPPGPWAAFLVTYAVDVWQGLGIFDLGMRALAFPLCNQLEIMVLWRGLRRTGADGPDLSRRPDLILFAMLSVLAPAMSGGLATAIESLASGSPALDMWPLWTLADGLSMLIFLPLLLAIRLSDLSLLLQPGRRWQVGVVLAGTVAAAVVVFAQDRLPLLFAVFPLLVLAAFTLGARGVTGVSFLVVAISFVATGSGHGPLSLVQGEGLRLLILQAFWLTVVVVTIPVTTVLAERERMSRKLVETQSMLDTALGAMGDGFAIVDGDGRFVVVNRKLREMFLEGADLRRPGADLAAVVRGIAEHGVYADASSEGLETWVATKIRELRAGTRRELPLRDGRCIEVVSTPIAGGGIVTVYRDVTERKQLGEAIARNNRRLEQMNAELDQFTSITAHDLRAPLRQIGMVCDWLAKELGDSASETVETRLVQLQQRARRMSGLIESLRAYAHAGARDLPAVDLDLAPIVEAAIDLIDDRVDVAPGGPPAAVLSSGGAEPAGDPPVAVLSSGRAEPADILWTATIKHGRRRVLVELVGPLPRVRAPEAAIGLVVRNLIANAVKHHDLADGRVRIRGADRPNEIELVIEDDGPGIPAPEQAVAFDLLARFRGDHALPMGIGLSLVRRTVSVHGGQVWFGTSSFGRGTAVHVTWPKSTDWNPA